MKKNIAINQTQKRLIIKISNELNQVEIMEDLKEKTSKLKKIYKTTDVPIHIIGKALTPSEKVEIEGYLQKFLEVEIVFDENKSEKSGDNLNLEKIDLNEIKEEIKKEKKGKKKKTKQELGLHTIKEIYEEDTTISNTMFFRGSVRSGQKVEYDGSLVIIGDVNSGSEVIVSENIVVLGVLRGVAHAGAKGNTKAIISATKINSPQIRIANVLKEMEAKEEAEEVIVKREYAYVKENQIVIE